MRTSQLLVFACFPAAACAAGVGLDDSPSAPLAAAEDGGTSGPRGVASPGRTPAADGGMGSSSSSGAASSSSSGDADGAPPGVPTDAVVRRAEDCWSVGAPVESLSLGTTFVLDLPSDYEPTVVLGVPPANVPGASVQAGDPGRTRVVVPLGSPIEWFLGFARFEVERPGDSANYRACNFHVDEPGWLSAQTGQWVDYGVTERDRDVGTIPLGGGLVVEGLVFGYATYRIQLEPAPGDLAPVRTTDFGYAGYGAYVFSPTTAGDHSFDLRLTREPSTDVLYHVHLHVTP